MEWSTVSKAAGRSSTDKRDFVFIESRKKANDVLAKGCLGAMTGTVSSGV